MHNFVDIVVVGNDLLTYSIVGSLLLAHQKVVFITDDEQKAKSILSAEANIDFGHLHILTAWPDTALDTPMAVLITNDVLEEKLKGLLQIEAIVSSDTIITVNMESIHLEELQDAVSEPSRLFGLNWSYPAHRTYFAEIISNSFSRSAMLIFLEKAVRYWKKDPYIVKAGFSIRARMFAAMLREGMDLVENGYASVESVDRACRNDAGYYLPFAGNFRYMDLMGTYAYGMVMEDLNKELSNMDTLPPLLVEKRRKGYVGLEAGQGFYTYSSEEQMYWKQVFGEFSEKMEELIAKYPHAPSDR